ncbi:STAS domain-containing protein [Cyanobium sp. Morenito 9A2]|uniref:STAS domain-containing protein n=1 Tax=Cyanobium sp. Morenito 9A2 TaxID=2823718 RepID=UPI0020CE8B91|nr:STAS domain-containing protein [Cyanobium sp. Morenito 9A2]MCP9849413.1 STAS domain-containing protein [Cyanobium sp. Morenito 9A2]
MDLTCADDFKVADQSAPPHDDVSTKVIALSGVLDALMGKALRDDVNTALGQGFRTILIDFQAGTYIDSNGFGALIACLKKTKEAGVRLSLRGLNSQVRLVMEMTGTDRIFDVFNQAGPTV